MDGVALARTSDDERRAKDQVDFQIERASDARHDAQRWARPAAFDHRDVAAREADRVGELLLRQAEVGPGSPTPSRECDPEGLHATQSTRPGSPDAYLLLDGRPVRGHGSRVSFPNPSISAEVARKTLVANDEAAASVNAAGGDRAALDAAELHDLERSLYYGKMPDTPSPAAAPMPATSRRSVIDRLFRRG